MSSAYTNAQLSRYLEHLSLPPCYTEYIQTPDFFPRTEDALKDLFRGHITLFPYENLTLYYSTTNPVIIEPDVLYEKMLGPDGTTPAGRGGYCFEVNIFFHHVLIGLGFSTYMTGVRNRIRVDGVPVGDFRGWVHGVNVVRLPSGDTFLVDAAFGGDGPTAPFRLVSGAVMKNLGTQEVRLMKDNIPQQRCKEPKYWIYQYRNGHEMEWMSHYCFLEVEWFHQDFEVINRFTSWETLGRGQVLAVRFIRKGEQGEAASYPSEDPDILQDADRLCVIGKVMLVDKTLKLNMGGRTRVIEAFGTEQERLQALQRWFSIEICA
ncbi:predicted protein [Aspergillus udagawae]|nr:predicted protein [Aspergillus udagawae]